MTTKTKTIKLPGIGRKVTVTDEQVKFFMENTTDWRAVETTRIKIKKKQIRLERTKDIFAGLVKSPCKDKRRVYNLPPPIIRDNYLDMLAGCAALIKIFDVVCHYCRFMESTISDCESCPKWLLCIQQIISNFSQLDCDIVHVYPMAYGNQLNDEGDLRWGNCRLCNSKLEEIGCPKCLITHLDFRTASLVRNRWTWGTQSFWVDHEKEILEGYCKSVNAKRITYERYIGDSLNEVDPEWIWNRYRDMYDTHFNLKEFIRDCKAVLRRHLNNELREMLDRYATYKAAMLLDISSGFPAVNTSEVWGRRFRYGSTISQTREARFQITDSKFPQNVCYKNEREKQTDK